MTLCPHCGIRKAYKSRGLCNRCYTVPAIRQLYAAIPSRHRGVGADVAGLTLPEPTTELSGTEGKVAVFEARAAAGLALFHPKDERRTL